MENKTSSKLNPEDTIKKNINRRKQFVDKDLSFFMDLPLPSWIELSIIDVCNRKCSFCPKSDESIAPDTYQKSSVFMFEKLATELKEIGFNGAFALCGYGEPYLHKNIYDIINILSKVSRVEVVTNGDLIKPKVLQKSVDAGVSKILISMYDNQDQVEYFKKIIDDSGISKDIVILRDRWYDDSQNFGVKLTNRSGTIDLGNQAPIGMHTTCYYPSYQLLIDWNGDVFLCPQDWQRRVTMGNIMHENFFDIWKGSHISKFRKCLLKGDRSNSPCNKCNATGTLLGESHAEAWRDIYKID